jgi:hypothetical protein
MKPTSSTAAARRSAVPSLPPASAQDTDERLRDRAQSNQATGRRVRATTAASARIVDGGPQWKANQVRGDSRSQELEQKITKATKD